MDRDEYNKRRAARESAGKADREARDAKDLEVLDALEAKHGNDGVRVIDVPCAAPLPGIVVIKAPEPSDFDLWQTVLMKDKSTTSDKKEAHVDFATSVLLYPERDVLKKMIDAGQSGLFVTITGVAAKFAAAGLEARGKE
jgi:hypothetical protein